jgi:antitoxin ParD1/3/4
MVTRNVVLTSEQAELVERLVSAGRYQNASEALRAGLRLLERDEVEALELRDRLLTGLRQARQGDFADGDGQAVVQQAFAAARNSRK